jgi:hypothetical protein
VIGGFVRVILAVVVLALFLLIGSFAVAQSPNGSITGMVLDPDGKSIPGAEIIVVNDLTAVKYVSSTNGEGIFTVANLPPGPYRIQLSKVGFKTIIKPDIILNVQDAISINFTLPIGATSVTVTVEGGAPLINTTNGSVSTVVDRTYIENMPLNGRSFQNLILLVPGVVTNSPQVASTVGDTGEFSVNGQRTESNYYTVDGVSANTGTFAGDIGAGASGGVAVATALGTTQPLASVDALQEFRVQTSTYSAEYGRNPGGQFSFATRSGSNEVHGGVFDYLRNNIFDANNWFNNYFSQAEPPLRQNDFGGTLSGPVEIPHLYSGKDKTFFFLSYEGLRAVQPQASTISYVPDSALRQMAAAPLEQIVNAFPKSNGADLGNGLAEFIGTWSNPSSINSYSVRLDHSLGNRLKLFFRFGDTASSVGARLTGNPSTSISLNFGSRTYTLGATSVISSRLSNEFRLNYTENLSRQLYSVASIAGSPNVDLAELQGISPGSETYFITVSLDFGNYSAQLTQGASSGLQRQWNLVDCASILLGRHQLKFGVDYRRLTPVEMLGGEQPSYSFLSANDVQTNNPGEAVIYNHSNAYPLYLNSSAFAQDEWKMTRRVNVSLGLRWDVNPAPGVTGGLWPYTVNNSANLGAMTLAPQGTPLWRTTWHNFAPRFSAAYLLRGSAGWETVLRGGGGLFFDTGQQLGSLGFNGPGFFNYHLLGHLFGTPASFPLPNSDVPGIVTNPTPPYGTVYAYPTHLQLPYTLQWNIGVEQGLGKSQVLSLSYVGSHASRLLEENVANAAHYNSNFTQVVFFQNGLSADYDALQAQFQRRINRGLTALASYTLSHSTDYGSQDFSLAYIRGNSDFDVRHSLSSALSYDLPTAVKDRIGREVFGHWGVDDRFTARTAFPVTLAGGGSFDPATGKEFFTGLNLTPGVPVYLNGPQYPGGRAINPAAFSAGFSCTPTSCSTGDAPRNFVRGFGMWQMDLAVRREFPIHERLRMQFRGEAFNFFNHPNFGHINPFLGQPTFGQATSTLNTSLGTLSPLYQAGGPRSLQFALKVIF